MNVVSFLTLESISRAVKPLIERTLVDAQATLSQAQDTKIGCSFTEFISLARTYPQNVCNLICGVGLSHIGSAHFVDIHRLLLSQSRQPLRDPPFP